MISKITLSAPVRIDIMNELRKNNITISEISISDPYVVLEISGREFEIKNFLKDNEFIWIE